MYVHLFLLYFARNTNFLQIGILVHDLYTFDCLGRFLEGHDIAAFDSCTAGGIFSLFHS